MGEKTHDAENFVVERCGRSPGMETNGSETSFSLRLFGPFEARLGGELLPATRTRTETWLLALLALRHERSVDRGWLAETLWPESRQENSQLNLRRSLSNLRAVLGPEAVRLECPSPRAVRLNLAGAFCDLVAFDAALRRGDEDSLLEAAAHHRGPLLEGCAEPWIEAERQPRAEGYLHALERLAGHATDRGDHAAAARWLRQVVVADPTRESAQRALMGALAACGARAAITRVYRDLRLFLHRELNAAPDAATTALYERLRVEGKAPAESSLRRAPPPRRLPAPLTTFVGRERETAEVLGCLNTARLVTLTGAGGIGKTRLALQVAGEVAEDYPGGTWFVDLGPVSDPDLVPQAIAAALEQRDEGFVPVLERLKDRIRTNRLLLLLDNCEHLIEACARITAALLAACPALCLLATSRERLRAPGERLYRVPSLRLPPEGLAAGDEIAASALPTPSDHPLLAFESVRLFVERASWSDPTFRLADANARAVCEICRRLDGIPLAIELAVAQLPGLGAWGIAARLDDRFHLLTRGERTAVPRHQTLRATLDWSYELLAAPERALLSRLSIFAGGWTLEAAEAVCADEWTGRGVEDRTNGRVDDGTTRCTLPSSIRPLVHSSIQTGDVLDLLTRLVEKSLAVYEDRGGAGRYRLLETVRQYARARLLESGEEAAIQGRHRAYFLQLVERSAAEREGPEGAAWLARVEEDHDNLRAALEGCLAQAEGCRAAPGPALHEPTSTSDDGRSPPDPLAAGLRLVAGLCWFWGERGYVQEGRGRAQTTLAAARERSDLQRTVGWVRALRGAGNLALRQDDYAAARSLFSDSLSVSRELGYPRGEAVGLGTLAAVAIRQGDYAVARQLLEQAMPIWQELGDQWGRAACIRNLGVLALKEGDYPAARSLFDPLVGIEQELGCRLGVAMCRFYLGWVALQQGQLAEAAASWEETLALYRERGHRGGSVLHALAVLAHRQERDAEAEGLLKQALEECRDVGDRHLTAQSIESLAALAAGRGQAERAALLYGSGEALWGRIGAAPWPVGRNEHERCIAALRTALGEAGWAAACSKGRALTLERVLEYALESPDA